MKREEIVQEEEGGPSLQQEAAYRLAGLLRPSERFWSMTTKDFAQGAFSQREQSRQVLSR